MKRLLLAMVLLLSACRLEGESYTANVERVVDGDTIRVAGGQTIRLIGVDTPETKKPGTPVQCYGPEASKFAEQLMPEGSQVRVVLDSANGTKPDPYGRTLAYVVTDDPDVPGQDTDLHVNLELIQEGYGKALSFDNTQDHKSDFAIVEKGAKAAGKGLWSACGEK